MQIKQIVIDYHSVQDRLLLSLHAEGDCVRIWLTRRYVVLLRAALADIFRIALAAKQPLAVGSAVLLAELEHERAVANFDISVPVTPLAPSAQNHDNDPPACTNNTLDLNDNSHAWLAFGLQIQGLDSMPEPCPTGLTIAPQKGEVVTLNLENDLPHALAQMLAQACEAAEWSLDFTPLGVRARATSVAAIGTALH